MLIMRFTVALIVFVLAVNFWFARPILESVMFAVALAVGLTPELLPMIVTVTLARSAMQMAKRKVIVKRLSAIHDVGAMNVLCTDKTGTLTEAKIKLLRVIDGHGAESANAFSYAYVNSKFETGIKSPLDEAILAARPFDMTASRRSTKRHSISSGGGFPFWWSMGGNAAFRQRRPGGYAAAIDPVSGRRRGGEATHRRQRDRLSGDARRTWRARLSRAGHRQPAGRSTPGREPGRAEITDETDMVFAGFAVFLDPPKASAGATIRDLEKAGVT